MLVLILSSAFAKTNGKKLILSCDFNKKSPLNIYVNQLKVNQGAPQVVEDSGHVKFGQSRHDMDISYHFERSGSPYYLLGYNQYRGGLRKEVKLTIITAGGEDFYEAKILQDGQPFSAFMQDEMADCKEISVDEFLAN